MQLLVKHVCAVLVVVVFSAALALAEDVKVVVKPDLPEAVLNAFRTSFPDVKASGYDREIVNGQTRYEIETKVGQFEKDYVYLEDGTLLQIEQEVAVDSLPKVVIDAVKKAHPGCEVEEAETITRGSITEYEVVIEVDEREYELLVSSEGKILASDQMAEDEDEEEPDADDDDEDDDAEDEQEDD